MLIFRILDLVLVVSEQSPTGLTRPRLEEPIRNWLTVVAGGMGWSLRGIFYKKHCFNRRVFCWIPDSSGHASGSRNNFLSGVLGDYFGEYKGIATLNPAPFYLSFFFVFNNLTTPQLCVTHLQDSPYSQQSKRNLQDGKSISLHRMKQMSVLVTGNLHVLNVLWLR